ncbi:3'-hydroxy-N-methyl-(S)-coclaurine 4'-O-methyltransferase 2 [Sesamum alatum]|uniref:3'-hydroxy-N-methyl-(S)-coclaurine 4'-O-methyltransferase 2 n=1 Tax=Sesamum alatum TaxID=300844 RepID=A0AAE2CJR0_9LAMI|nr:3'-hydroxy-N-methyl-(S)-coclaurine 4'-O-methyltransferase 2 [Sesamum alatum]
MDEEAQARVDVWKYAYGFDTMRVVKCMIELRLPDVLENHGRPMTLSELSSAVGCPETSLHRILRFLTHIGIFKKLASSTEDPASVLYAQTPLSRLLTRENMGPFMLVQAGPPGQQFGLSADDLRAGKGSGREAAPSENIIWTQEIDDAYDKMFQEFLASHARASTKAIIDYCPEAFEGIGRLVDVGGHEGTAVGMLVKAFPSLKGINFDRPEVVSAAPTVDGVEHVGGDMFQSVPKADAVMLMKCKEAVPADTGKVIIVDVVIDEEGGDEYTGARLAMDMVIMSSTVNGKERTVKEWGQLLDAAGFSRHTIKHMKAIESVIEAYP